MPELNFRVKIRGGKRTPTEVHVTPMSVNEKVITFVNGRAVTSSYMASVIDKAIINFIRPEDKED